MAAPGPRRAGSALVAGHSMGGAVTHGDLEACDAFDVSARLGEVRVPALVACGSEDRMTPPRLSRSLAEGIPAGRLEVGDGAGHMLPLEAPARVAALLDAPPR